MAPRRTEFTELVQTRIDKKAHALLEKQAGADMRSVAAFVRHLIYHELGIAGPKE